MQTKYRDTSFYSRAPTIFSVSKLQLSAGDTIKATNGKLNIIFWLTNCTDSTIQIPEQFDESLFNLHLSSLGSDGSHNENIPQNSPRSRTLPVPAIDEFKLIFLRPNDSKNYEYDIRGLVNNMSTANKYKLNAYYHVAHMDKNICFSSNDTEILICNDMLSDSNFITFPSEIKKKVPVKKSGPFKENKSI